MLGEMVKPEDWDKAIMIMFTIALSICLLIIYEVFSHLKKHHTWNHLYQNPIIIGLIFVIICYFLFSTIAIYYKSDTAPSSPSLIYFF
ncbi:hypothetical protein ACA29_08705 [Lederbergia galactosidilytica]|uniref:Uncharacterized protein n=1 Tax=Lederbergia galactosidilytica TaxID=217031 RepID=A0A0Q9Y8I9_9BACI|nr:hypothetical protein ACA29_08705 [Lederbergia galactosidilytica]